MKLDKKTLAKWKDNAKDATQGEWLSNTKMDLVFLFGDELPICTEALDEDVIHIANACPQNFIALIDKILELENHLDIYCKCPSHGPSLVHFNENE